MGPESRSVSVHDFTPVEFHHPGIAALDDHSRIEDSHLGIAAQSCQDVDEQANNLNGRSNSGPRGQMHPGDIHHAHSCVAANICVETHLVPDDLQEWVCGKAAGL